MQIDIQIGGESVRLREAGNRSAFLWPFWPMDLFRISSSSKPDIDIEVTVTEKLPELKHGKLVFDADHGLWKLHEAEGGYYLEVLYTKDHTPLTRSFISPDFRKIKLWFQESPDPFGGKQSGWTPAQVLNPVAEICLLTRIAREGGVWMHASCVKADDAAYVFSGPSGAGKSTIAEFFVERNYGPVFSDEKVIMRRHGKQLAAYGTPWYGSSRYAINQTAPLERFFLISHGVERHQIRSLSFTDWSRRFLQECSLPYWDRQGMEQIMVFLEELMQQSGCCELSFLKNADIVDFLTTAQPISLR